LSVQSCLALYIGLHYNDNGCNIVPKKTQLWDKGLKKCDSGNKTQFILCLPHHQQTQQTDVKINVEKSANQSFIAETMC
jgi:hypothetical protein